MSWPEAFMYVGGFACAAYAAGRFFELMKEML